MPKDSNSDLHPKALGENEVDMESETQTKEDEDENNGDEPSGDQDDQKEDLQNENDSGWNDGMDLDRDGVVEEEEGEELLFLPEDNVEDFDD